MCRGDSRIAPAKFTQFNRRRQRQFLHLRPPVPLPRSSRLSLRQTPDICLSFFQHHRRKVKGPAIPAQCERRHHALLPRNSVVTTSPQNPGRARHPPRHCSFGCCSTSTLCARGSWVRPLAITCSGSPYTSLRIRPITVAGWAMRTRPVGDPAASARRSFMKLLCRSASARR